MEIRVAKANPKTRFNLSCLYLPVVYLHSIWRIFWLSKPLSVEGEKGNTKIVFWKSLRAPGPNYAGNGKMENT